MVQLAPGQGAGAVDEGGRVGQLVGHRLPDVSEVPRAQLVAPHPRFPRRACGVAPDCPRVRAAFGHTRPTSVPASSPEPGDPMKVIRSQLSLRWPRVDFALPAEDDPRREPSAGGWRRTRQPSGRELAERGLVAPHWPEPWGIGADATHQLIVDDELRRAGVRRPTNTIGIGWAGPTILHAGTAGQKDRYLMPLLAGEEIWCQLFSEPGAGSDLASLTTRADRDGDEWVVRGQKVWTSYAHGAQYGILLARTEPEAPVHDGHLLLHLPDGLAGGDGAASGRHDRDPHLQRGLPRRGPSGRRLPDRCPGPGVGSGQGDPGQRAGLPVRRPGPCGGWDPRRPTWSTRCDGPEGRPTRSTGSAWPGCGPRARSSGCCACGRCRPPWPVAEPGPEASVRKALADEHGQHVMALARDLVGARGMLRDTAPADRGPGDGQEGSVARGHLGLRVPVRPGPDHRGRHLAGTAQHRGRAHPGPAPRSRRPDPTAAVQARMGPASSYPCRTPRPACRVSCSGS